MLVNWKVEFVFHYRLIKNIFLLDMQRLPKCLVCQPLRCFPSHWIRHRPYRIYGTPQYHFVMYPHLPSQPGIQGESEQHRNGTRTINIFKR